MSPTSSLPTFVSYSHDSEDHKTFVLELSNKLVRDGIDCWCDRYVETSTPERGWPAWMEEKIRLSNFVLVVCSPRFLEIFEGRVEKDKGLGGKFESSIIVNDIYQNGMINSKFLPVIFNPDDKKYIPTPLQPYTYYCLENEYGYELLYRRVTNQPLIKRPQLGTIKIFELQGEHEKTIVKEENKVAEEKESILVIDIPEITEEMTSGLKIVQAFYTLPMTKRFAIASELGLLENGESYQSQNRDQICIDILKRAKQKDLLGELWTKLFDEKVDPNPFK